MDKLTPKQKAFCDYYIELGNATEAAVKAGYSKKTAKETGYENLNKKLIKEYIEKGLKEKEILRKTEGQIRVNPKLLNKLLELFGEDIEVLTKNIEKVLMKEFLIDDLTEEELKKVLRRNNLSSNTRYSILERAAFKCQCCGNKPNKDNDITLHIDHIIPFSLGGKDTIDNFQVLCNKCNISKNNRYIHNHNIGWGCLNE